MDGDGEWKPDFDDPNPYAGVPEDYEGYVPPDIERKKAPPIENRPAVVEIKGTVPTSPTPNTPPNEPVKPVERHLAGGKIEEVEYKPTIPGSLLEDYQKNKERYTAMGRNAPIHYDETIDGYVGAVSYADPDNPVIYKDPANAMVKFKNVGGKPVIDKVVDKSSGETLLKAADNGGFYPGDVLKAVKGGKISRASAIDLIGEASLIRAERVSQTLDRLSGFKKGEEYDVHTALDKKLVTKSELVEAGFQEKDLVKPLDKVTNQFVKIESIDSQYDTYKKTFQNLPKDVQQTIQKEALQDSKALGEKSFDELPEKYQERVINYYYGSTLSRKEQGEPVTGKERWKAGAQLAADILVPYYGTVRNWKELNPVEKTVYLGLDTFFVVGLMAKPTVGVARALKPSWVRASIDAGRAGKASVAMDRAVKVAEGSKVLTPKVANKAQVAITRSYEADIKFVESLDSLKTATPKELKILEGKSGMKGLRRGIAGVGQAQKELKIAWGTGPTKALENPDKLAKIQKAQTKLTNRITKLNDVTAPRYSQRPEVRNVRGQNAQDIINEANRDLFRQDRRRYVTMRDLLEDYRVADSTASPENLVRKQAKGGTGNGDEIRIGFDEPPVYNPKTSKKGISQRLIPPDWKPEAEIAEDAGKLEPRGGGGSSPTDLKLKEFKPMSATDKKSVLEAQSRATQAYEKTLKPAEPKVKVEVSPDIKEVVKAKPEVQVASKVSLETVKKSDKAVLDREAEKIERDWNRMSPGEKTEALREAQRDGYTVIANQPVKINVIQNVPHIQTITTVTPKIKGATSPDIKTIQPTKPTTRAKPDTSLKTTTDTTTALRTMTTTNVKAGTATKAATITKAQVKTQPATAVRATITQPVKTKPPLPPPPPPPIKGKTPKRLILPELKKRKISDLTPAELKASAAWDMGFGYWVVPPPYRSKDGIFTKEKPKGMTIHPDMKTAFSTIQTIGKGRIPAKISFNRLGIVKATITRPPRQPGGKRGKSAISFSRTPSANSFARITRPHRTRRGMGITRRSDR